MFGRGGPDGGLPPAWRRDAVSWLLLGRRGPAAAALRARPGTRPLAGASVRVGALATDREAPAVAQATVRAEVDEPLDVHGDHLAELALDPVAALDDLAQARDLVVGELEHARALVDA